MMVNIAQLESLSRKRLYQGQPATSAATLWSVPVGSDAKVTEIVLCNTTGAAATVSISAVPAGGTPGPTNRLVDQLALDPHETVVIGLATYLTVGDFLAGLQDTAGAVTVTISGELYS